jgi:hypothetical protein
MESTQLLHSDVTERILGIYYDVYNELGHGFLESVYNNSMSLFRDRRANCAKRTSDSSLLPGN